MDPDLWSKAMNLHGSLLMQTLLDEVPEPKSDVEKDKQEICKFICKKKDMLFKVPEQLPGKLIKHSVPIVPIEMFRDVPKEERIELFYKSLDRGHILIFRVVDDTVPDYFKLLVLCKEENHMKLDDLSIYMYLSKDPTELELAGGNLECGDFIRAAVCACWLDERKLLVTLHRNILEDVASDIYLGKITERDLPFYLGKVDLGKSYVDFLNNAYDFIDPKWSESLRNVLDLKDNYLYSFLDGLDGKKYEKCVYGSELKQRQLLAASNAHYIKAVNYYENGKFDKAIHHFGKTIKFSPKHVEALVSRGILYSNKNNLSKAFKDLEAALKIDPKHERASKQMSVLLVAFARYHIKNNNFESAKESLVSALYVDSTNQDAATAYEELQKLIEQRASTVDDKASSEKPSDKSSDKASDESAISEKTSEPGKIGALSRKQGVSSTSRDQFYDVSQTPINKGATYFTGEIVTLSSDSEDEDSLSSKTDDLKEISNQNFNLEAATKMFLSSLQKRHKEDPLHTPRSPSKSPKRNKTP